ncbi:GNAT family N-acetyltransferase [Paucisalibacillus sp. EB02]|uniref:GNAT family N-acetyltransferase n=1 Tax=Paucisalibacillus sp. EB02 TaxID=1347087 RepID=UPI0004ACC15F|nr:GNAT family N-acetyltransferase [Paucisalibacillus sp. EB02]
MLYKKQVYLRSDEGFVDALVRNYGREDFNELIQIQAESFPPPFPSELWWSKEQLDNHVTLFPDGALCVEVSGVLAGSMTGVIVEFDPANPIHTWEDITNDGYIRNHNPHGNTLYVVDICIRPTFRKLALGKLLMQSMYEVVIHKGLERLLGGGRMPGYHKHANTLSAEAYLEQVVGGKLKDPVLSFLLNVGRMPIGVIPNYLEDEESLNYAVLMEWKNPFMTL